MEPVLPPRTDATPLMLGYCFGDFAVWRLEHHKKKLSRLIRIPVWYLLLGRTSLLLSPNLKIAETGAQFDIQRILLSKTPSVLQS